MIQLLEDAQSHKEELERKMRGTWGNKKYWYYNSYSYFSPISIDENTWDKMQFASVNSDGEVIGYLSYSIDRECRFVSGPSIINFTNNPVFGIDVMQMVKDIFEKYNFQKIDFFVIIGNPIERQYDRLIRKYGGRIVGIHKRHVMLPDGKLYDEKMYEILREDYLNKRYGKDTG